MRHSGPDGGRQAGGDSVFAISQRHPHWEALGKILAHGVVPSVGRDEIHVVPLRLDPTRRRSVAGVKCRVRCFVDEDLLKEALRLEPIRLAGMDENIVVAAAEGLYPPVNPDRLEFRLPKGSRQLANQPAVFVGCASQPYCPSRNASSQFPSSASTAPSSATCPATRWPRSSMPQTDQPGADSATPSSSPCSTTPEPASPKWFG